MDIIKGKDLLKKAVDKVCKTSHTFQADLHIVACSALAHLIDCGDPVYITRLMTGLHTGTRKKSLQVWFKTHGAMTFDDTGVCVFHKEEVENKPFTLEEAIKVPYWELVGAERDPKPLDIGQLIKMIQRRVTQAEEDGYTVPSDDLLKLSKVTTRMFNAALADEAQAENDDELNAELKKAS